MKLLPALAASFASLLLASYAAGAQETMTPAPAEELPRDAATSAEVKSGKVVWDISVRSTPRQFLNNLTDIRAAYDALDGFGVKPEMIFVFRGDAITWLSRSQSQGSSWARKTIDQITGILSDMQNREGVRMVADPIAGAMIRNRASNLMTAVTVVDNAFVELINYQSKGYALIQLQ
jgi:intracellular sulfur oxidation DsrE/DsrF family protein